MNWSVEFLDEEAKGEIDALPVDIRARFARIAGLIEEFGLPQIREPYVKHLEGRLWEMRMKGRDGIARAIYVTAHEKRVVVVTAFVKKTQKTPQRELRRARHRAEEVR